MENVTITEKYILRYLLGELSETEQSLFEEAFVSDPQVFTQVSEVENDLIDDYVRGRLASHERQQFERHYLANSNNRQRVQIAEALTSRIDRVGVTNINPAPSLDIVEKLENSTWRQRLFAPMRIPRLAFGLTTSLAALLVILGGSRLFNETNRLRQEAQATRTDSERRELELKQQIADEKQRNSQLANEIERLRNQPPPQAPLPPSITSPKFASLLLIAGALRDNNATVTPTLSLSPDKTHVRLTLKMEDSGYPNYHAEIQSPSGEIIWSRENLKPALSPSIAAFNIILPSGKFSSGAYILAISGVNKNGNADTLSKSTFRVDKN